MRDKPGVRSLRSWIRVIPRREIRLCLFVEIARTLAYIQTIFNKQPLRHFLLLSLSPSFSFGLNCGRSLCQRRVPYTKRDRRDYLHDLWYVARCGSLTFGANCTNTEYCFTDFRNELPLGRSSTLNESLLLQMLGNGGRYQSELNRDSHTERPRWEKRDHRELWSLRKPVEQKKGTAPWNCSA